MSDSSSDIRLSASSRRPAVALGDLTCAAEALAGIRRSDVAPGDRLLVSTKNSIYSLVARADGRFDISGGRFARESGPDGGTPLAGSRGGTR